MVAKGRHQLHVKIEGQHIRGSPLIIAVKSSVEELGPPILSVRRVVDPWGAATNQQGEIVVTDYTGCAVSVFSPGGEKVRSFDRCISGEGQLMYPCGVAVDD